MKIGKRSTLFFLTILMFSACEVNDNVSNTDEALLLDMSEIKTLGIQHNEALGAVFNELKNYNSGKNENPKEIINTVNSGLDKYYKITLIGNLEFNQASTYSRQSVSKYIATSNSRNEGLSPIESALQEYVDALSIRQIELLEETDNALDTDTEDVTQIIDELNEIQKIAISELSEKEAQIILIGTEIGKSSLAYWSENIADWEKLNSEETGSKTEGWFSWSKVAGSDVAGAVGGAVAAAVVNVVPGAGQVAYGGAIVGGAAGGSAASAVSQVWDHLF